MQAGNSGTTTSTDAAGPFALIVGSRLRGRSDRDVETAIRHSGLRPEALSVRSALSCDPPIFRLRFSSMTMLAGRAADAICDQADPALPETSLIAASLATDWRDAGRCWMITPEIEPRRAGDPGALREYFKALVVLIDLFDASHIFWSPAQLWSDAAQFRDSVAEMLTSGMPPVLHLVAFRREAGDLVRTRGLALFGGQEIEGQIPPSWTVADMVRRLARLALDIILNGTITGPRRVRGLEPGEWVTLTPMPGKAGQPVRVRVAFSGG